MPRRKISFWLFRPGEKRPVPHGRYFENRQNEFTVLNKIKTTVSGGKSCFPIGQLGVRLYKAEQFAQSFLTQNPWKESELAEVSKPPQGLSTSFPSIMTKLGPFQMCKLGKSVGGIRGRRKLQLKNSIERNPVEFVRVWLNPRKDSAVSVLGKKQKWCKLHALRKRPKACPCSSPKPSDPPYKDCKAEGLFAKPSKMAEKTSGIQNSSIDTDRRFAKF